MRPVQATIAVAPAAVPQTQAPPAKRIARIGETVQYTMKDGHNVVTCAGIVTGVDETTGKVSLYVLLAQYSTVHWPTEIDEGTTPGTFRFL